jgi:osmotically-inducible protein OsmY
MRNRITARNATIVAALAAVAATAWAANGSLSDSTWVPHPQAATPTSERASYEGVAITDGSVVAPAESLATNERVMPLEAAALPAEPESKPQPRITVEQRRLSADERIQATLMDVLAQAPNMSGSIGVESRDQVVTLSGWTATSGQAQRAVRYAYAIDGVKDVQNEIRPRVGWSM